MEKDQEEEDRDLKRKCTVNLSIKIQKSFESYFPFGIIPQKIEISHSFQLKRLIKISPFCQIARTFKLVQTENIY